MRGDFILDKILDKLTLEKNKKYEFSLRSGIVETGVVSNLFGKFIIVETDYSVTEIMRDDIYFYRKLC